MDYFVLAFLAKFAAGVALHVTKACLECYKASKKPDGDTSDK